MNRSRCSSISIRRWLSSRGGGGATLRQKKNAPPAGIGALTTRTRMTMSSSSSRSPFLPFVPRYHDHDHDHHCYSYYSTTTANNHHHIIINHSTSSSPTRILLPRRTRGPLFAPHVSPPVRSWSLAMIRQASSLSGGGGTGASPPPPPKKKPSSHRHRQPPQKPQKPQTNSQEPMVTTTSISSLQDHWESTKQSLLHQLLVDNTITTTTTTTTTPITPSTIHLFQETLKYFMQQDNVESCWELLHAAAANAKNNANANANASPTKKEKVAMRMQIPSLLFSSILQLWQTQVKTTKTKTKTYATTHSSSTGQPPSLLSRSPRQIAQWIDEAQRLGILERRTNSINKHNDDPKQYWAAILLNVASYLATTSTITQQEQQDDYLTFSVEYLQEWIDEAIHNNSSSSSSSSSSLPDQVVVGTVLQGLVAVANQQQQSPTSAGQSWGKKNYQHRRRRRRQHQAPDHPQNEAIRRVESFWENVIEGQLLQGSSSSSSSSSSQSQSSPMQPSMFWFHSMISMYAKQGHVEQVQVWMTQMQDAYHLQPDLVTWNSLLQAYAKRAAVMYQQPQHSSSSQSSTTSPAQQAQRVLDHMKDLYYNQGKLNQPPDVVSYSTVLDAWAQQAPQNPQAALQAEQLLDRMRRAAASADIDEVMARPNIISYNTVIQAHGRAGNVSAAERLFSELMQGHETNMSTESKMNHSEDTTSRVRMVEGGESLSSSWSSFPKPNDVTISIMLSVWLQVGTWEAAERSEKVLRQVLPPLGYAPDVVLYGICLACWAKVLTSAPQKTKGATPNERRDLHKAVLRRAEALWDEMVQKQRIQPDVVAYTNMMNIYGNSNQPEKAEALLQEMIHHQQSPNVHTLSVLLSAWTRSSHRDGVSKAQACLDRMEMEFGVQPNVVSYTTLLQAWSRRAKQGDAEAPDKALELLRKIGSMANARSYAAVIQALAQQGRAQEAQDLLEEMLPTEQDERKGASTRAPPPDVYAFSAVLHAWSKTRQVSPEEAAQRAEQLVLRMHDLYERRVIKEGPNVVCFSNVLKCWSQVEVPSSTTNQQWNGAERAQAILERMEGYGVKPNLFSINIVLNAWANQARVGHPEAIDRATALLDYARSSLPETPPDEYTYRALFKAISSSPSHIVPDKYTRAWKLVDEMKQQGLRVNASYLQRLEEIRLEQERAQ